MLLHFIHVSEVNYWTLEFYFKLLLFRLEIIDLYLWKLYIFSDINNGNIPADVSIGHFIIPEGFQTHAYR